MVISWWTRSCGTESVSHFAWVFLEVLVHKNTRLWKSMSRKIKIKVILTPGLILLWPSSGANHCPRTGILQFTLTCSLLKRSIKIMWLILLACIVVLHVRDEISELRDCGPWTEGWRLFYFSERLCQVILHLSDYKSACCYFVWHSCSSGVMIRRWDAFNILFPRYKIWCIISRSINQPSRNQPVRREKAQ